MGDSLCYDLFGGGWMILSLRPVVIGFLLSIICTVLSYCLAILKIPGFMWMIISLWIIQTAAQCIFFFLLGKDERPFWNLQMFLFMIIIVFIVVGGSAWIMYNLNYMMMPK
jgi:cytochrome o ubiquinol oxidase subunit IV